MASTRGEPVVGRARASVVVAAAEQGVVGPESPPPPSEESAAVASALAADLLEEAGPAIREEPAAYGGQSEVDPPDAPPATPDALSLDAVRQHWPRVIERVAERRPFVASYLEPAELHELRDGWLELTFAYKLHHDRVAERTNRALVEEACTQVLGQSLRLRCKHIPPTSGGDDLDLSDPVLRFALERFGGRAEIVNE